MYDGFKKAIELAQRKTSSLKSSTGVILIDKNKQMKTNKWLKHYSHQNNVYSDSLDCPECLQTMDDLDSSQPSRNLVVPLIIYPVVKHQEQTTCYLI